MAPAPPKPPPESAWPLVLRRAEQAAAAAALTLAIAVIGGLLVWQGRIRSRRIDIDRAEPVAVEFKIDVNSADWPELALLPDVGEQLAKRIVQNRRENGPFRDLEELRRVRGIGPRILEGMRPWLLPMPDAEATAGTKAGRPQPPGVN